MLPGAPPAPAAYVTSNAFPGLTFIDPVVITSPPGETNRLFVVEQNGRILQITNLAAPTTPVTFLDITARVVGGVPNDERGLLGLAFHPDYANNHYFYVYYSTMLNNTQYQRLSRFEGLATNPNFANPNSEVPLMTLPDESSNHNGGDLHFGPDGYLYISTGDEGGANDTHNNSQYITKELWSGILRIDVDNRPGNLPFNPPPPGLMVLNGYSVPTNNPYIGVTVWYGSNVAPSTVRTEFYAIGLRNPWRMSFDRMNGLLYCGDVGQGAREEIDIIVSGGNYGWAFREGLIAGPDAMPPGAIATDPIHDYPRTSGFSVTGGVVYYGSRLPTLNGLYIFADFGSGNVWSLEYNGVKGTNVTRLTGETGIASFGIHPGNGDVLIGDLNDDQVKRLAIAPGTGTSFPPLLSGVGAFSDLATLTPHPGIIEYAVNNPSWLDGATARRWFSIPNVNLRMTFRPNQYWTMQAGQVWIQHIELQMTNGVPESRRRIETRFLVRETAQNTVYGLTYKWNEAQTDADLVPDAGLMETLTRYDGETAMPQTWIYPTRTDCRTCHNLAGGFALGFNTHQLNRNFNYNGVVDNQLRSLNNANYFLTSTPTTNLHLYRAAAAIDDETASVEYRVRSFLLGNCASCHLAGGGAGSFFNPSIFQTLPQNRIINGALVMDLGVPANRVIVPEDLDHSIMYQRLLGESVSRMPPIGPTLVNTQAVELFRRWITQDLAGYKSFPDWQVAFFDSTNVPNALPLADPDLDGDVNNLEYFVGTNPTNSMEEWPPVFAEFDGANVNVVYERVPNRGFEVQSTLTPTVTNSWLPMNIPENKPVFAASPTTVRVPSPPTNNARFYRVRVFEH